MEHKGRICVIMADMTMDYRDEYVIGVEKQANKLGYSVAVFSMPLLDEIHTKNEESVFELVDFERYDGVVFFEKSFAAHKSLGKKIEKNIFDKCSKPVVVIGKSDVFEEMFFENNRKSYEKLTDHIIEKHGCEVLYFLGGQQGYETQRDAGFIDSLKKHGLVCTDDNLIYGGFWQECSEKLARDIAYHNVEKPDAVMCYDDSIAFFLIKAFARYGIRVPEDITVAGFGARTNMNNNIISITTCPCDAEYLGRKAVSRLCSMISGENEIEISQPRNEFVTGMSCGCGRNKPLDTRLSLELHEKKRIEEIYYNNSELEEKLFDCKSYEELFYVISNTMYIVPDKCFVSVNISLENGMSKCIYMTDRIRDGNFTDFEEKALCPTLLKKNEYPKNLHVIPLCFKEIFLGHAVIGYDSAMVYNYVVKKYFSRLAIAIYLIKSRMSITVENTSLKKTQSDAAETIFVLKDGALHKTIADNILMFESEGRKTIAVLKAGRYEVRKTLRQLEEILDKDKFMRISKSALINLNKVRSITPDEDRTLIAELSGKKTVRVSRKNVADFKNRIGAM